MAYDFMENVSYVFGRFWKKRQCLVAIQINVTKISTFSKNHNHVALLWFWVKRRQALQIFYTAVFICVPTALFCNDSKSELTVL